MRNFSHRNAFTLIEILVVLITLSILAAMVTTAVSGVRTTAREARTKRIISIVDSVIAEQYEQLRYRPLPVEIPALYNYTPTGTRIGYEVLADEAARVRLMMLRDLQRMELPDRYADITDAALPMIAAASLLGTNQDGEVVGVRDRKDLRQLFEVSWFSWEEQYNPSLPLKNANMPAKTLSYRRRLKPSRSLENQGAECLYLILATSFVGGQSAIGAIPSANIGDTDGDEMLEILDGWGRPIQFVRWPVGWTPGGEVSGKPLHDFESSVDVERRDDFDLFNADYCYVDPARNFVPDCNSAYQANSVTQYVPWSMRPLVFSLGEDGAGGVAVNPGDSIDSFNGGFSYVDPAWAWPVNFEQLASEEPGRGEEHRGFLVEPFSRLIRPRIPYRNPHLGIPTDTKIPYIDPYLRRFWITSNLWPQMPGALLGSSNSELLKSAAQAQDNITNYQLQVTQ